MYAVTFKELMGSWITPNGVMDVEILSNNEFWDGVPRKFTDKAYDDDTIICIESMSTRNNTIVLGWVCFGILLKKGVIK